MIRERLWPEAVDPVELLELYRLLSGRQNELGVGLLRLLSRIEHYLYERLSIEEIEAQLKKAELAKGWLILLYHRFDENPTAQTFVTPARFALVLKWLSRLETHFPRASAVALSGMRPVECEWALREAGAIHVARTVRQLPTVMQIVAQHSHQLPQERIGVAERILADLPWGD